MVEAKASLARPGIPVQPVEGLVGRHLVRAALAVRDLDGVGDGVDLLRVLVEQLRQLRGLPIPAGPFESNPELRALRVDAVEPPSKIGELLLAGGGHASVLRAPGLGRCERREGPRKKLVQLVVERPPCGARREQPAHSLLDTGAMAARQGAQLFLEDRAPWHPGELAELLPGRALERAAQLLEHVRGQVLEPFSEAHRAP
jgi:hypothetical protein